MKPEIKSAIDSTNKMINDKIEQLGIDFVLSNISEKCSFCPSDATGVISQEIPLREWIIGMYFSVCDFCGDQKHSAKIFDDLIKKIFSLKKPPITETLTINELQRQATTFLKNDLQIKNLYEKEKDGGFEIVGVRKSGLKIIFRYKDMNNFAYVFTLNGEEKFRVDTAAHHLLPYGPDHLHDNKLKNIKACPTFGSPFLDKKFLNMIIANIESQA